VLLIHGFAPEGNVTWQFNFFGVLVSRYNLYVPDLMFFGKSSTASADRSPDFQVGCVAAALVRCDVVEVGFSDEGMVAFKLAEVRPDRVGALDVRVRVGGGHDGRGEQGESIGRRTFRWGAWRQRWCGATWSRSGSASRAWWRSSWRRCAPIELVRSMCVSGLVVGEQGENGAARLWVVGRAAHARDSQAAQGSALHLHVQDVVPGQVLQDNEYLKMTST
jgi:pimeloyl-ACP methyl ester carboxylesterase